jgi:hypothetical protein
MNDGQQEAAPATDPISDRDRQQAAAILAKWPRHAGPAATDEIEELAEGIAQIRARAEKANRKLGDQPGYITLSLDGIVIDGQTRLGAYSDLLKD